MARTATLLALALAFALPATAQTVETVLAPGSAIDDALVIGPDGALYGSRFGTFQPFAPGRTVTRVDLSDGSTSVYADGFSFTNGLAFDAFGNLFVASYYLTAPNQGRVSRVTPSGAVEFVGEPGDAVTLSGLIVHPTTGALYVTSYDNDWIKTLSSRGVFGDVVSDGGLDGPAGLAFDDQNRLHVANFDKGKIFRVENGTLTLLADLGTDIGFLAYGGGRFFATGIKSHEVYAITPGGEVSVVAGTGDPGTVDGPAGQAQFNGPNGIAATASGDTLYVSESRSRAVRRIVLSESTAAEDAPAEASELLMPAPHPVAGETTVRYRLGAPADVEVTLSDVLGRRVRVVDAGRRGAGLHRADFSADGLASGLYVLTLRHGDRAESRTVVVL